MINSGTSTPATLQHHRKSHLKNTPKDHTQSWCPFYSYVTKKSTVATVNPREKLTRGTLPSLDGKQKPRKLACVCVCVCERSHLDADTPYRSANADLCWRKRARQSSRARGQSFVFSRVDIR